MPVEHSSSRASRPCSNARGSETRPVFSASAAIWRRTEALVLAVRAGSMNFGPDHVRHDGGAGDNLLRAARGLLVILSQAPAFQAQDALGSPGINLDLAEHQASAVPLERDVLILNQPVEVGAAQVQVTRHLVYAESPVRHTPRAATLLPEGPAGAVSRPAQSFSSPARRPACWSI